MMFNATFNNSSVISWRSVLLVEKTTDLSQVTDKRAWLSTKNNFEANLLEQFICSKQVNFYHDITGCRYFMARKLSEKF